MAAKKGPTTTVVRSAKTGQFVPAKEAARHPSTTVKETVKKGK